MEHLGRVNGYLCQSCGWGTLTINLNDGLTPTHIECKGNAAKNPNAPENIVVGKIEHIVSSSVYRPEKWWADPKQGVRIERAWIRPTVEYLSTIVEAIGQVHKLSMIAEVLEYHMQGGLLLVRLDEAFNNAPVCPDFHKSESIRKAYLRETYLPLLKETKPISGEFPSERRSI